MAKKPKHIEARIKTGNYYMTLEKFKERQKNAGNENQDKEKSNKK